MNETTEQGEAEEKSRFLTPEQASFVFHQILADYGLPMIRQRWEGMKPSEMKENLARRLGSFDWPTIARALDRMPAEHPRFPPIIPELMALCRASAPMAEHKALPAPEITPEEMAKRAEDVRKIAAKATAWKGDTGWAERIMENEKAYPSYSVGLARAVMAERELAA